LRKQNQNSSSILKVVSGNRERHLSRSRNREGKATSIDRHWRKLPIQFFNKTKFLAQIEKTKTASLDGTLLLALIFFLF